MISLQNLALQRGDQELLKDANLTLYTNDRVGLIGRNGTGKTSLFKLLLGELSPDAGNYHCPSDWRLAIMRQETSDIQRTCLDHVLDGHSTYRQLEADIAQAERNNNGEKLAELFDQWEQIDGYSLSAQAMKLLNGLGFKESDHHRQLSEFSGGWRIRLNLAQALMTPSDLLLLDEPTNHLDVEATVWLEGWLQNYSGTLIIISHDRDFLDNIVTRIVHIDQQTLTDYTGNYSQFEQQLSLRQAQQAQAYQKQQETIAHLQDFIRRFKAKASKAKQAQSRVKALARMEQIAPLRAASPFSFHFQAGDKLSTPLLTLQEVSVGYEQPLLEKLNLSLLPGAKIGLLGANGQGKSTLIKLLTTELKPMAGEYHRGEHCHIGYFSQHQQQALDGDASPLLHLQRQDPKASEMELRTFLGSFAFHGDRVFEAVKQFSGGEKARLALALIAWKKPTVLLLDEPTNHLDLTMREALEWAIQDFSGAMILISHDRHLLRSCCDEFWWVHNGRCEAFDGTLDDYQAAITQVNTSPKALEGNSKKAKRQAEAAKRANLQPLTKEIKQLERQMEQLHKQIDDVNQQLTNTQLYEASQQSQLAALLKSQGLAKQELNACEERWIELSEALDDS